MMGELIIWWRMRRLAAWQWCEAKTLDLHDAAAVRAKRLMELLGMRT